MKMKKIDIREIDGFRLGTADDPEAGTGVAVIISEEGAVAGVDVRGGAPATRETDLLRSENTVDRINAVVISGGSAFGLEAGSGVMRSLAEKKIGFKAGEDIYVPIVTGASLYDLPVGRSDVFPDVEMGRKAVENAFGGVFESGNHGAGTGASVGKYMGMKRAMKTGLGTFACGDDYVQVGAIAAVNAVGDVYNGAGNIIAGLRTSDGKSIQGTIRVLKGMVHEGSSPEINLSDIKTMAVAEALQRLTDDMPSDSSAVRASSEPVSSYEKSDIVKAMIQSYENDKAHTEEETDPEVFPEESVDNAGMTDSHEITTEPQTVSEEIHETIDLNQDKTDSEIQENPVDEGMQQTMDEPYVQQAPEDEYLAIDDEEPEPAETSAADFSASDAVKEAEAVEQPDDNVNDSEESVAEPVSEPEQDDYINSKEYMADMGYDIPFNTTISCLITNAVITKSQANKLASILHDAYARAIKPVHGTMDGDTIFVMSTCKLEVNFDAFAALATDVLQYAIIDGAASAESAYGLPASKDIIHK